MADLGDGTHLADALLGPDADLAATTLSGWAAALAGLHRAGRDTREAFEGRGAGSRDETQATVVGSATGRERASTREAGFTATAWPAMRTPPRP